MGLRSNTTGPFVLLLIVLQKSFWVGNRCQALFQWLHAQRWTQLTPLMKLAAENILHLLTKHLVVGLDKILQQSKQSLAKFQILSLCPLLTLLWSHADDL